MGPQMNERRGSTESAERRRFGANGQRESGNGLRIRWEKCLRGGFKHYRSFSPFCL